MLPENTFGHDLDPDYLIGDNYGYSNDGDIIQISVIDIELQQKIKKGLEEDQIAQQVIKGLTEKELTPLKQELAEWHSLMNYYYSKIEHIYQQILN